MRPDTKSGVTLCANSKEGGDLGEDPSSLHLPHWRLEENEVSFFMAR